MTEPHNTVEHYLYLILLELRAMKEQEKEYWDTWKNAKLKEGVVLEQES